MVVVVGLLRREVVDAADVVVEAARDAPAPGPDSVWWPASV